MQKCATTLCALFLMAFMSGCGGGSTTAANLPIYDKPASIALANPQMGGAIQGSVALDLTNKTVSIFAGTNGVAGSTNTVDPAKPVSFNQPVGITTDGQYLYVADTANNMIRRIEIAAPHTVIKLAGSDIGVAGYTDSTDGTGKTATFNAPTAITVSGYYLYVADTGNNMIRRVHKITGAANLYAGSTTGIAGSVDSRTLYTDVRFNQPTGITTDGPNLYVTDFGNHTVRWIVISSDPTTTAGPVTTLAGAPGVAGSVDAVQSAARFNQPVRITTDREYLYVTDSNNRTIRRINLSTGMVETIAGISGPIDSAGNIADSTDGTGKTARFNQPNGITSDGVKLYVTDSFNNSIRVIEDPKRAVSSGPVTTLSVSAFNLKAPIGITTDGTALYVVDCQNNTIRKIQ